MSLTKPYNPPAWLKNGLIHTIVAHAIPRKIDIPEHKSIKIDLRDGDCLFLDADRPNQQNLSAETPILLMMHGLGGSSTSDYLLGVSSKLASLSLRVFRSNLRGCGPLGRVQSKGIYHSGSTADLIDTLQFLRKTYPIAPIYVAGFSLSANIVLLALGKHAREIRENIGLSSALAVCPPIDLEAASVALSKTKNKLIDYYYQLKLKREIDFRAQFNPELEPPAELKKLSSLREFDELFTAPKSGFSSRSDYYSRCSSAPHLGAILTPTTVLASGDDPIIPKKIWNNIGEITSLNLTITRHGGHLGFVSKARGEFGDRRWLESFVVDWISGCTNLAGSAV